MVRAVPDVPGAARRPPRRAPRAARARRVVRPVPARRPDGRARRLPRDPTRSRRAPCAGSSRERPRHDRPVDDPDGRVHGVGRDDRARPAARAAPRRRARRRDARRLPPRHVRPRRADAADPSPRRARARGRVARRAGGDRPAPPSGGKHPTARGVRAEYLYGSYSNGRDLPDDPTQLVARAHGYELELGAARLAGRRHAC